MHLSRCSVPAENTLSAFDVQAACEASTMEAELCIESLPASSSTLLIMLSSLLVLPCAHTWQHETAHEDCRKPVKALAIVLGCRGWYLRPS